MSTKEGVIPCAGTTPTDEFSMDAPEANRAVCGGGEQHSAVPHNLQPSDQNRRRGDVSQSIDSTYPPGRTPTDKRLRSDGPGKRRLDPCERMPWGDLQDPYEMRVCEASKYKDRETTSECLI